MSRIGNQPVAIPSGVELKFEGGTMSVTGPKGALSQRLPGEIAVEIAEGEVRFNRASDKPKIRALHGLARALVGNMVTGVTQGFSRELDIQGVGYRADTSGGKLNLLLGLSHPVNMVVFRIYIDLSDSLS